MVPWKAGLVLVSQCTVKVTSAMVMVVASKASWWMAKSPKISVQWTREARTSRNGARPLLPTFGNVPGRMRSPVPGRRRMLQVGPPPGVGAVTTNPLFRLPLTETDWVSTSLLPFPRRSPGALTYENEVEFVVAGGAVVGVTVGSELAVGSALM